MRWIPIWISLATFFSCIPILSHDANHSNVSVSNGKRAHVPHILTSCTAEMDLTTGNENLLSHRHTTTRTQQIYTNTLCRTNTCIHAYSKREIDMGRKTTMTTTTTIKRIQVKMSVLAQQISIAWNTREMSAHGINSKNAMKQFKRL